LIWYLLSDYKFPQKILLNGYRSARRLVSKLVDTFLPFRNKEFYVTKCRNLCPSTSELPVNRTDSRVFSKADPKIAWCCTDP